MNRNPVTLLLLTLLPGIAMAVQPVPSDDDVTLNSLAQIVNAGESAPALLGVVREQHAPDAHHTGKGATVQTPPHVDRGRLLRQMALQQKRILQLTGTIAALNTELVAAKEQMEKVPVNGQQLSVLQSQLGDQQQKVSSLNDALQKANATITALKTAATNQQGAAEQLTVVQASLKASQTQATQLQAQVTQLQQQTSGLKDELKTKDTVLTEQQAKLAVSQKLLDAATRNVLPVPETPVEIRDYAIGTSLATDMLSVLNERAGQGVKVDPEMALAGVTDTFTGKYQVSQDKLKAALEDSEKELAVKQQTQKTKAEETGKKYLADFVRQHGVKKDIDGFAYRIDYAGLGDIHDTDIVSVVVSEALTNGTVVKDMEAMGTWVSQPVNAYPPLFQKAIRLLKNHGRITLVVPPALAYGDAGDPPSVPPGATMIYKLRIRDVSSGKAGTG